MKAYSSVDILGKESRLAKNRNLFSYLFESWIEKQIIEVELSISIPHFIYRRTTLICDYIKTELEMPIRNSDFVDILFTDFIHRYMRKYNLTKMYEELTKYNVKFNSSSLQIIDHMNNSIYTFEREENKCITFDFTFSKENVKRVEIFLADLHESKTNQYLTVEEVISRLWINFIQSFSDGNNEKAVDKLMKLAEKNF